MPEISIRTATIDDVPLIVDVLAASLGEKAHTKKTPALFHWKHFDNPFGESLLLIAEEGGVVVGVRALMRWDLTTPDGQLLRCLRAVDTATRPGYQGRGIFTRLTTMAVEMARDKGIDLIFNTPNEKSGPGYLKMGWKEVGWIRPLVKPRLGGTTRAENGAIPKLERMVPKSTPIDTTRLIDRTSYGLRTRRSQQYYNWRFENHPSAEYGWLSGHTDDGLVVRTSVRNQRPELIISDCFTGRAGPDIRNLINGHRSRYAVAAFSTKAPEYPLVRTAGFFHPPRVRGLRLVANRISKFDYPLFDLASWDLAMSDVELL